MSRRPGQVEPGHAAGVAEPRRRPPVPHQLGCRDVAAAARAAVPAADRRQPARCRRPRRRAGLRDRGPGLVRQPVVAGGRPQQGRRRGTARHRQHAAVPVRPRDLLHRHRPAARPRRPGRRRPGGQHVRRPRRLGTPPAAVRPAGSGQRGRRAEPVARRLHRRQPAAPVRMRRADRGPGGQPGPGRGRLGRQRRPRPAGLAGRPAWGGRRRRRRPRTGGRWSLSNFGEWVNAWSAGEDLPSTFLSWPSGLPPRTGDLDPGPARRGRRGAVRRAVRGLGELDRHVLRGRPRLRSRSRPS